MTVHELYPSWVELNYTSAGRSKRALWPVQISGAVVPGVEPLFVTKGSGNVLATACVAALLAVAAPLLHTDATFDKFQVFHKATLTSPPTFIYAAPLGLPGTSSAATVLYSEMVFTYKTPEPGGLKFYWMEGVLAADVKHSLPFPSDAVITAFNDFILSDDNFVTGRNGNFPLVGISLTSKQNDFYRRKYKI